MDLFVALPAAPQGRVGWTAGNSAAQNSANRTDAADNRTMVTPPAPSPQLNSEEMGDLLVAGKLYQAAIEYYAQITQPSASVWNRISISYQMLYDLKGSVRCYKESLKLNPANPDVLNNLGVVQDLRQDFPAAEHSYRKALKLDPQFALALKNLGTNLLMQHKYDKSAEAYKQPLALYPYIFGNQLGPEVHESGSVQALGMVDYLKAQTCARAGLTDCAIAYLQRAFDEGTAG